MPIATMAMVLTRFARCECLRGSMNLLRDCKKEQVGNVAYRAPATDGV